MNFLETNGSWKWQIRRFFENEGGECKSKEKISMKCLLYLLGGRGVDWSPIHCKFTYLIWNPFSPIFSLPVGLSFFHFMCEWLYWWRFFWSKVMHHGDWLCWSFIRIFFFFDHEETQDLHLPPSTMALGKTLDARSSRQATDIGWLQGSNLGPLVLEPKWMPFELSHMRYKDFWKERKRELSKRPFLIFFSRGLLQWRVTPQT